MLNEKISQLTYAGPAQPIDLIPVARSTLPGQNINVTAADIAALAEFALSLVSPNGSIVVGGSGNSLTIQVNNTYLGALNILPGTYTYATLPPASANPNVYAATSDQGAVYSNGAAWLLLFNPTQATVAISVGTPLPPGTPGVAYSQNLTATGGVPPYTWSFVSQYGTGDFSYQPQTLSGANSGQLNVTSPVPGTTYIVVEVQDSNGAFSQKTLALTIGQATVATPTFSPTPGTYSSTQSVTLACSTGGAAIYYTTDGSTPTTSSTLYTGAISVSATETLKAIAALAGYTTSGIAIGIYTISGGTLAATPTFSPGTGTYTTPQTVTIACSTPSPTIYYTTDGSTPTTGSTVYTAPITVSATEIVQAIATASGYSQSGVGSASYTINPVTATPTFSLVSGTYTSAQTVAISCATGSSTIYYTTNGVTPTTGSTVYSGPISVGVSQTVQAIATAPGYSQSSVGSATYTISAAANSSQIKFNPGHYMAQAGNSVSSDISDLTSDGTGITGYVMMLTWANVDTGTSGPVYNFSAVDSAYTAAKAIGKHLIVSFRNSTPQGSGNCNPIGGSDPYNTSNIASGTIPAWLINSGASLSVTDSLTGTVYSTSAFPAAPNPSQRGWWVWGYNANSGGVTRGYGFVLGCHQYHPVGAAAYRNMLRALANHVLPSGNTCNNDSFFEMVQDIDELTFSFGVPGSYLPSNFPANDTTYKINGVLAAYNDINGVAQTAGQVTYTSAQCYRFIADSKTGAVASFPNTSLGCCDGFGLYGTDGQSNSTTHTNFMKAVNAGRVVLMGSDTFSNSFGLYPNTTNAYSAAAAWSQPSHPIGYATYWLRLYVGCAWTPMSGNPYTGTFASPPSYGTPASGGECFFNTNPGLVANNVENLDYNQNPSTGVSAYTQAMVNSIYNSAQYFQPPWSFWANTDNRFQSPDAWKSYIYAAIQGFGTYPFQLLPPAYMFGIPVAAVATSTTTATVTWTPATGVGTGLTYTLYRNGTSIATGLTSGTYSDTGLSANTAYTYTMAMSNALGTGPQGASVTVKTPVFSYPSGFAGSSGQISLNTGYGGLVGSTIVLITANSGHSSGAAGFNAPVSIANGFTSNFTFQMTASGASAGGSPVTAGMSFALHNDPRGGVIGGDANCCGYGAYEQSSGNIPIRNSIGIKFDIGSMGFYPNSPTGYANTVGLYSDGGFADSLIPCQDLNPYGVNLNAGNVCAVKITYDLSILTMTIKDTVTNAQARFSWPITVSTFTGATTAVVQIGAGNVSNVQDNLLTWDYTAGYATRLATPTFSVAPGQYSTTQTVTLSGPIGASIYYTLNGLEPTTSSTLYSGAITISSNKILKAIAIEGGYTDSFVATGNYLIQASGPTVNFPSGFASYAGFINLCGRTALSGSALVLTDGTNPPSYGETAAAWYAAPLTVSTFSTSFQFNLNAASARGIALVLQNQPPASAGTAVAGSTGGPFALSNGSNSMGFAGNGITNAGGTLTPAQTYGFANSVAVIFAHMGSASYTGVFQNGQVIPSTGNSTVASGLDFTNGHSMNVVLTYNGTVLNISITDSVTSTNFSTNVTINIPSIVGASTATVGFTGGDYGGAAQQINSWTMT